MQTDTKVTAKDGMRRDYHYVIKIPDHISERIEELEKSDPHNMLLEGYQKHWCAYVAVPKTHVMFKMDYHSFEDLSVGRPDVTDLNYSSPLEGYSKDNWYFGWDYNHSWNTGTLTETTVMSDIDSCIDWIQETAHDFEEDKVWHYGCPRCRNEQ